MKELRSITYRGVTSFYYKQDLRQIDKPADSFWRTEEPFLYTERSKGVPFKCSARSNRKIRIADSACAYRADLSSEVLVARKCLQNATATGANVNYKNCDLSRRPAATLEGSLAMCYWIQKEARQYLRYQRQTEDAEQKLNYNARYTNRFYGTISDCAERRFEDMEVEEKVQALAFKLQMGKNYVREMLYRTKLLSEIADEYIWIKARTIARKADLLKRRLLSGSTGML